MAKSRTKKSLYNFITAIGAQGLIIIMNFVCRTVFISTLGKTYLGISGLYSNILNMLSLAELGIGTAIIYYMYDPLATKDIPKISALMYFYKIAYRLIALIVAVIGLCLIPFLPLLISDYERLADLNLNAILIFLIYLSQSVSSYLFFAHRSVILKADQKDYIINIVSYIFIIGQNVVQILSLIFLENFTVYVLIQMIFVILQNLANAVIAQKMYPYIKLEPQSRISKEEIKTIFKDCGAVFIYKVNRVVLKSTDNIVISTILGLNAVGIYSNYYIFYTTINSIYIKINSAIIHSIGNLHTTNDLDREYTVFKALVLIMTIVGGTVCVGIGNVSDEFIDVWIGKDWILEQPFSMLLGIELMLLSIQYFLSKYRNAVGLFQEAKFVPIIGSIINIVVSVILVHKLGISGVILGTIIAESAVFLILDPFIIYKYGFKGKFKISEFYVQLFWQLFIILISYICSMYLCNNIFTGHGWLSVVVHIIICAIIPPTFVIIANFNKDEEKYLLKKFTKKKI